MSEMELDGTTLVKILAVAVILFIALYALFAFFLPLVSVAREKANETGTQVGGAVRNIQEFGRIMEETNLSPGSLNESAGLPP
ncbi:MAG: hypothetical protein AB1626_03025 [Candidatus Micrarchaeota archaeon]